jgi:hypothetical protein
MADLPVCVGSARLAPHLLRLQGIETGRHANTGIELASFRSNAATAATSITPRKRIAFSIVLPPLLRLLRLLRCCGNVCAGGTRVVRSVRDRAEASVPVSWATVALAGWLGESAARVGWNGWTES